MIYLLDANVLIAALTAEHEHHERASRWLVGVNTVAVCPITEGAFVRFMVRIGERATTASRVLAQLRTVDRFEFWADDQSFADIDLGGVVGHRQVTDTYLAALAVAHGGLLATFDNGLQQSHPDATFAVP